MLTNQKSARPTRKITAASAGGAAATVLVWIAQQLGLELDIEVATSMVLVASALSGYFARERV